MSGMRPEHCVTRNHIEVFHQGVLPAGARPIPFRTLLRGSLVPVTLWGGVAGLASVVVGPVAGVVVCGVFAVFLAVGFARRRRRRHSVRCAAYGAFAGVLKESVDLF